MFTDFQILALGVATVLDTVLLLSMLRRPNSRLVPIWLVLLTAGAWIWHLATFSHVLLEGTAGFWGMAIQWSCMLLMTAGLLLMPCAMLHGVARLSTTGVQPLLQPKYRHALLYLPLFALLPAAWELKADPAAPYLELLAPLAIPYVVCVSGVNLAAAAALVRLRHRLELPRAAAFCLRMAVLLVLLSAAICFVVLAGPDLSPRTRAAIDLLASLLPAAPVLLFAYFVIRFRFMPLVLEQTLAYGAIASGVLLLHHLVARNLAPAVEDRYHFDLGIVEGALGIALVLAYAPLRERTAEALRYLLGSRVDHVRDRTRELAVEMSQLAGQPPEDLLAWFVDALAAALRVEYVAGWLFSGAGPATIRRGDTTRTSDADALALRSAMRGSAVRLVTRATARQPPIVDIMERGEASLAVIIEQHNVSGLLMLGRQKMQQQPGAEETSALVLLIEQLAGTMSNSLLQADRLLAERRMLQSEKLSTLGLLAGSIAHEVKNPLSSIKTIASVLAEELGQESEHCEDLQLILSEIDRLSATTVQLLDFARPAAGDRHGLLVPVLECTLQIMRHVARQRDVTIDARLAGDWTAVRADENSLREICFNLLSNSIDAAGRGGQVAISCRQENGYLVTEFHDTGPGISPEVQDRLFEPFFTTKPGGTGLGLHVVARRVRKLGGEICCQSASGQGTSFIVKLPSAGDLP